MAEIKKINFSALKTTNADNKVEDKKEISPPEKIEIKNKPIVQVSLGKKKEVILGEYKKIKPIKEEKKSEEVIKIEPKITEKPKEINLSVSKEKELNIEKSTQINKKGEKTEEVEIGGEKLIKEPENLFNNYESDFSSKQDSIIDKLKKLKYLPKTRPKLVYSMLGIMIIGVSGLVFISPNDSVLKADILGVEQEQIINDIDLSKMTKEKAEKLKYDELKKEKEKKKKERLENFLLKKGKKSDDIPQKKDIDIKNKSKNKDLKKLLLEARKNK